MSERRWMQIQIDANLILDMFKEMDGKPVNIKQEGIPTDARLVDVILVDTAPHVFALIVESAEFEPIPEGAVPPLLTPVFTHYAPDAFWPQEPK